MLSFDKALFARKTWVEEVATYQEDKFKCVIKIDKEQFDTLIPQITGFFET